MVMRMTFLHNTINVTRYRPFTLLSSIVHNSDLFRAFSISGSHPGTTFRFFASKLFEMFACIVSIVEEIILSWNIEISCSCEHTSLTQ